MKFTDTFTITYYEDVYGQPCIKVTRGDRDHTVFKHHETELTGELVTNTRTRFTDTSGNLLDHPHVLAMTPQLAIAEAVKIVVDRAAAQLDPYPFEKEA